MSTHEVRIVPVTLLPHPNADSLSLVEIDGYKVAVRTAEWQERTMGAYIPPDSVVPDTEEYAFLRGHRRIRVQKLRGLYSQGLLMPAPEGAVLGENVAERLGITRYEPGWAKGVNMGSSADSEPGPGIFAPTYDVENLARYPNVIQPGEEVAVTEKVHGANSRWVWANDRMYAGSHKQWKRPESNTVWWQILRENPEIELFCRANPGHIVYAETYGWVQDLRYGRRPGQVSYAVFDILFQDAYLPVAELIATTDRWSLRRVPAIATIPCSFEAVSALADGPSLVEGAEHIREGIVIRTTTERYDPVIGRCQLKMVSNEYLAR